MLAKGLVGHLKSATSMIFRNHFPDSLCKNLKLIFQRKQIKMRARQARELSGNKSYKIRQFIRSKKVFRARSQMTDDTFPVCCSNANKQKTFLKLLVKSETHTRELSYREPMPLSFRQFQ